MIQPGAAVARVLAVGAREGVNGKATWLSFGNAGRAVLLKLFVYGVALLGLAALVTSAPRLPLDRPGELLLFVVLCAASQLMPVPLYRSSSISVAFAITFAGLICLGPAAAVWINLGSGLVMCFLPRRKPLEKAIFNVGGLALTALVSGWFYTAAGGALRPGRLDWYLILPTAMAIVAYFLLNTGLLATVIALASNTSVRGTWNANYRWLAPNYLALGLIGFGMGVAVEGIGLPGLTLFCIPLVIARYSFQLFVAKTEEMRRRNEELQLTNAVFAASPDLMIRLNRAGKVLGLNGGDPGAFCFHPALSPGKHLRDMAPPAAVGPMLELLAQAPESGTMQVCEYQVPVPGALRDFEARFILSRADEVLAIVRNNTERKALERELAHQAFHDPLTGLPNRTLLLDRLEHAQARAARSHELIAVLFLDLDRFKIVNDSLGHEAGDQLLIGIGQRMQACVRPGDTVARLGGDEFAILLEGIASDADARHVAERVMASLDVPFALGAHEVRATASIGIAFSTGAQGELDDLLRNADAAMYRGKTRGKARYEVFDASMHERALEHLQLESDLRHGIERGELRLYYQPKIALATGRLVGVEALVRWEHPERGLIPSAAFIPLAEETGLILPLNRWVLTEVCRQARAWQRRHPGEPPLMVSVNLSVRQFQHPALVQEVAAALREAELEPQSLMLEITESMVMDAAEVSSATLRSLKSLGVGLAIDDFGTGYSSLSYLTRFPVDMLKIDQSFVRGLGHDAGDTAIVHAVIRLAHALGLRVTAEGVENSDQLAQLRAAGCELGQGFFFHPPLSAAAVDALLESGDRTAEPPSVLAG